VFPFLGTILLHTLGFINRCPLVGLLSEKWTCNFSRQSFHQTKTLRRFSSSNASSPRLSSWNSREAMRSVEHQGSKPIHHFLKTVVLYTPKTVTVGVAHVLRSRTASRMRTFIWSLDVEEFTSLILLCLHRFKWDCACALLRACAVSF